MTIINDNFILEFYSKYRVTVRIEKAPEYYLKRRDIKHATWLIAQMSLDPSKENAEVAELIYANKIKDVIGEFESYTKFKKGDQEYEIPNLRYLPAHFVSFVKEIENELIEAIKNAFNDLRWVSSKIPQQARISYGEFNFSMDEQEWIPVPGNGLKVTAGEAYTPNIRLDDPSLLLIQNLASNRINEPIHHSLFREALALETSNPRASFIIAISSIEIAVKGLIAKIVPESEWLLENIPSPPVFKMIKDYLPRLQSKGTIDGVPFRIPKSMLKDLQKWVEIRNNVIHKGSETIMGDDLSFMLLCVRDMLNIIDFNCGYVWTLKFIRKETIQESNFDLKNVLNGL